MKKSRMTKYLLSGALLLCLNCTSLWGNFENLASGEKDKTPTEEVLPKIANPETKVQVERLKQEQRWGAVVKVFAVSSSPDFSLPWQNQPQNSVVGSGFVISGNRILTNAHIVADQTFMMVRRPGDAERYVARLLAVGHECDLAILTVDDPKFFEGINPLEIGVLPDMQSQVTVLGYPIGGDNISITEGVLSRVEPVIYSHSAKSLLGAQVDAAINPGNSGGPVLHEGKVIGVAFQGLSRSQSIGYIIPASVVTHFLKDVEKHNFDGFPDIPFAFMEMQSPDLRKYAKMSDEQSGIMVTKVSPEVAGAGNLLVGDVILAIDDVNIANDATVPYRNEEVVFFGNLIWEKYIDDIVQITVLRGGEIKHVELKLGKNKTLVQERTFDRDPSYYFIGGLVFVPLTVNYLDTWDQWWKGPVGLVYYAMDGEVTPERSEIVVLSMVLADSVNVGYQELNAQAVVSVNGKKIKDLKELIAIVEGMESGFVVFGLKSDVNVVLDIAKIREATPQIMARYRIPADRSENLKTVKVKSSVPLLGPVIDSLK